MKTSQKLATAMVTLLCLFFVFSVKATPPGMAIAWGDNGDGQLNIPPNATNLVAIAGGYRHSLALQSNGTVTAWGYNLDGETNVPPNATNVIAIAGGGYQSLALRADGKVVAWGYNAFGETNVPPNATNITAIAGGCYHCMALRTDGIVVAWGAGSYVAVPDDYVNCGQSIVPASLTNAVAIAAGYAHSLAVRSNRTLVAWGRDDYGQTDVPANATNVTAIAAGDLHSLALRADGTVVAWGYNEHGETNVPPAATNVVAIAACNYHSLALRADGKVICWGANDSGQSVPPAGLTNVLAISAGAVFSMALFVAVFPTNPPVITQSPLSRTLGIGGNTLLSCQVIGDAPFSYQWRFNSSPIIGATSATLILTNVTTAQAGLYDVVVIGPAGTTTSAAASVALFGLQMVASSGQPLPLLTLDGAAGTKYRLEASWNLALTNWVLLAPVILQNSRFYFVDLPDTNHSMRFYRAVPQ